VIEKYTPPTWVSCPQRIEDEHDWVKWFAPGRDFRGIYWDVQLDGLNYSAVPRRAGDHG